MTADLRALLARHPAPWKIEEYHCADTVLDANGSDVFDDGSAGGEYRQACKPETMALIVSAVNALPGLLDALAGMERERDACCADYQREAARAEKAEADLAEAVGLLRDYLPVPALDPAVTERAEALVEKHEGAGDE